MQRYSDIVLNGYGNPLVGASVEVVTYPALAAATIYQADGSLPYSSNILTTDSNGRYYFYAADGRYSLNITKSGYTSQTITDVLLEDPANGNAATVSTLTATGLIDISGASAGQIKFPATQNASSNANTLDDYEEGTWTPVLTFVTPGDLSVAYTTQVGVYTKVGRLITVSFVIQTSSFTYTTASGNCRISGLPFTSNATTGVNAFGGLSWGGITKASYTNIVAFINSNTTFINLTASGSGQAGATIAAADMPSGGTVLLRSTISYIE